jgi:ClpP class serine protease
VDPLSLLWLYFILASLQPVIQRQILLGQRRVRLRQLAAAREATVITMIHRQETMSFLGFPIVRYIDIDDAESTLRAIRGAPDGQPILIILHTPGGLVFAASQIAAALADHSGRVTAVIPHYAMSGGTLISLAADEIVVDRHSALGPVDPQLGNHPAASIVAAVEHPGDHDDETLILSDIARKAIAQTEGFTGRLLERHLDPDRARQVAHILATGTWTHDHPLYHTELAGLGLPVKVGVPKLERGLMELYPQPRGREPAVEYVPGPPVRPTMPRRRELPRPAKTRGGED